MKSLKLELMKEANEIASDYFWYQDAFYLVTESFKSTMPLTEGKLMYYLRGDIDVGDSIEDEWVIALIVYELSKRHHDLIVCTSSYVNRRFNCSMRMVTSCS